MQAVLVAGTHGYRGGAAAGWYCPGSPFVEFISRYLEPVFYIGRDGVTPYAFTWDTELGGIGGKAGLVGWEAWGEALEQFYVPRGCTGARIAPEESALITHSHGRQVALFAFKRGLKVKVWIDVCGPIRRDLLDVQKAGRANVGQHIRIYSDSKDYWQWWGQAFDGHVDLKALIGLPQRVDPLADVNALIPGGHTVCVDDPEVYTKLPDQSWWPFEERQKVA